HRRGEPLPPGGFHLVVHVWLRDSGGRYLLSQRAADRPTFPLMWETTGGSVLAGEDSLAGALREAWEELGVRLNPEKGRVVFSQVRDWVDGVRFGDIVDVWQFEYSGEAHLEEAGGEVKQAQWLSLEEAQALYRSGQMVGTLGYFFTPGKQQLFAPGP
ncbi:MAG: NUDIX domain-containing protein, partial [Acutalibacter sp.]|nr:NUDIX domain-containing protein [Acutalibacter sp.]